MNSRIATALVEKGHVGNSGRWVGINDGNPSVTGNVVVATSACELSPLNPVAISHPAMRLEPSVTDPVAKTTLLFHLAEEVFRNTPAQKEPPGGPKTGTEL